MAVTNSVVYQVGRVIQNKHSSYGKSTWGLFCLEQALKRRNVPCTEYARLHKQHSP